MSYEYFKDTGLGALGWVRLSGESCRVGSGAGIMRCVPSTEVASARNQGAVLQAGTTCSYMSGTTRRTGAKYCFPAAAASGAPAVAEETEGESFESFLDRLATGAQETVQAVSSKLTGQQVADKVVDTAARVALVEGENAEDALIPFQETPEGRGGGTWLQQYMPHITIASTLIGLGTFVIWLAVRSKDKKEDRREHAQGYR
jgi:hypothetical protein